MVYDSVRLTPRSATLRCISRDKHGALRAHFFQSGWPPTSDPTSKHVSCSFNLKCCFKRLLFINKPVLHCKCKFEVTNISPSPWLTAVVKAHFFERAKISAHYARYLPLAAAGQGGWGRMSEADEGRGRSLHPFLRTLLFIRPTGGGPSNSHLSHPFSFLVASRMSVGRSLFPSPPFSSFRGV